MTDRGRKIERLREHVECAFDLAWELSGPEAVDPDPEIADIGCRLEILASRLACWPEGDAGRQEQCADEPTKTEH